MILVDSRLGSGNLIALFKPGTAMLTTLEFGDFAWIGNGPSRTSVMVGVERKQIGEVCSTIVDKRFASHQLPGLAATYQIRYLVVEGIWRAHPKTGVLQHLWGNTWKDLVNGKRRFMAADVSKFIATVEEMGGMRVRYTTGDLQTVSEVQALHSWWVNKEWEEHRAHLSVAREVQDTILLRKPTVMQRMVACLPGLEWKRSAAACKRFKSILEMVVASEEEWMEVEGIGKGLAARIVGILQGGGKP